MSVPQVSLITSKSQRRVWITVHNSEWQRKCKFSFSVNRPVLMISPSFLVILRDFILHLGHETVSQISKSPTARTHAFCLKACCFLRMLPGRCTHPHDYSTFRPFSPCSRPNLSPEESPTGGHSGVHFLVFHNLLFPPCYSASFCFLLCFFMLASECEPLWLRPAISQWRRIRLYLSMGMDV